MITNSLYSRPKSPSVKVRDPEPGWQEVDRSHYYYGAEVSFAGKPERTPTSQTVLPFFFAGAKGPLEVGGRESLRKIDALSFELEARKGKESLLAQLACVSCEIDLRTKEPASLMIPYLLASSSRYLAAVLIVTMTACVSPEWDF